MTTPTPVTPGMLSTVDVISYLRLNTSDASSPTLSRFIAGAQATIEYICGPVIPQVFTETYDAAGRSRLILRQVPVMSIASIAEIVGATSYPLTQSTLGTTLGGAYGYTLDDPVAGILTRRSNGIESPFYGGTVTITYTAGYATVPADVKLAALEDVRALWQQTQQPGRPSYGGNLEGGDEWGRGGIGMFPRLNALLSAPSRTQSIA